MWWRIAEGDLVVVDLQLDTAPRVVVLVIDALQRGHRATSTPNERSVIRGRPQHLFTEGQRTLFDNGEQ
jgi:hypothetical protein